MSEATIKVDLFRQDNPTDVERLTYQQMFRGYPIEFNRIDPVNYIEHNKACEERQPTLVQLPKEHPIPHLAMHEFPHVVVTGDGRVLQLTEITTKFVQIFPPA